LNWLISLQEINISGHFLRNNEKKLSHAKYHVQPNTQFQLFFHGQLMQPTKGVCFPRSHAGEIREMLETEKQEDYETNNIINTFIQTNKDFPQWMINIPNPLPSTFS